jgi:hypothetical protein
MEKQAPTNGELIRFRSEAAALLGEAVAPVTRPATRQLSSTPTSNRTARARITPGSLDQLNREAYLLRMDNKLEEARAMRAEVVESAGRIYAKGDPRLVKYQNDYLVLLVQMRRYPEAEVVAREALDSLPPGETAWRQKLLRSLVDVYEHWPKPDELEHIRKLLANAEAATRPSTMPTTIPTTTGPTTTRPDQPRQADIRAAEE